MTGKIAEIFSSLQGEGIYLGERQIFVRFFGCNLSCKFCDTPLSNFKEYSSEELFREIKGLAKESQIISFTGGEPLLQKDFLKAIIELTSKGGFKNYLETNGTLSNALGEVIDYLDIIAMDLKLPTSTGLNNFWEMHRQFLKIASKKEVFLKAVICESTEEKDLIEAINLIKEMPNNMVLVLQPNSYDDASQLSEKLDNFRDICTKSNLISYIIPQMHRKLGIR